MLRYHLSAALTFTLALVATSGTGCTGGKGSAASTEPAAASADEAPVAQAPVEQAPAQAGSPSRVEVAPGGTKFDPPVKPEQLPPGAWMCDMMGKVHYAAMEPGDGKCPVCGMKLSQHAAGAKDHDGSHDAHGEVEP